MRLAAVPLCDLGLYSIRDLLESVDDAALSQFDLEAVLALRPRALQADVRGLAESGFTRELSHQALFGRGHPPRPPPPPACRPRQAQAALLRSCLAPV